MEQIRKPDARYQIGAGKLEELSKLVQKSGIQKIIFDNPLKPIQAYNIAKATHVETIDRFQLILEIFAKRAITKEAKLQIQLAKIVYELAHAKEKVRLARISEQPGFRGLGAYEVDVYHNAVKKQISTIRKKLRKIRKKRLLHRKRRAELGFSTISLAGYTNAGKSSLFNILTKEEAPVDTKLFTTLSTTTRFIVFSRKKLLLIDTVGFIDRLPLELIEAFHSTLEETNYSDLILLLVDVSEENKTIQKKLSCCLETIEQIGASGIPIITVLNKIDLLSREKLRQRIKQLKEDVSNPVPISALYNINIDLLQQEVLKVLNKDVKAAITIPITNENMSFISWLSKKADVQEIKYVTNYAHIILEANPWFVEKIKNRIIEINGKFEKIKPKS
jgi:GTP-binding protein HflX